MEGAFSDFHEFDIVLHDKLEPSSGKLLLLPLRFFHYLHDDDFLVSQAFDGNSS